MRLSARREVELVTYLAFVIIAFILFQPFFRAKPPSFELASYPGTWLNWASVGTGLLFLAAVLKQVLTRSIALWQGAPTILLAIALVVDGLLRERLWPDVLFLSLLSAATMAYERLNESQIESL